MVTMKRKIPFIFLYILMFFPPLYACSGNTSDSEGGKTSNEEAIAYAYCSTEYNASFGNYGTFCVSALDNNELEKEFNDLSKFTLKDAFSEMTLTGASYSEEGFTPAIVFSLSGTLSEGKTGSIEGEGIIKGKSVKVTIPITEAQAESKSRINVNYEGKQKVDISLLNACFNKNISSNDFLLDGALKNMTIESIRNEVVLDDLGEEVLSQEAELTITGFSKDEDYGIIDILPSATTYNETLRIIINTQAYGVSLINDHIDTFTLKDTINVQSDIVTFNRSIKTDDITLGGVLKDYATIESIEYTDQKHITVNLSFPYTFVGGKKTVTNEDGTTFESVLSNVGYLTFGKNVTDSGKEFVCSIVVKAPELDANISTTGQTVHIDLTIKHEEFFTMLSADAFRIYRNGDGTEEIVVKNKNICIVDGVAKIDFTLPDDCNGLFYLEIEDAYDVISNNDGKEESVTIRTYFYI